MNTANGAWKFFFFSKLSSIIRVAGYGLVANRSRVIYINLHFCGYNKCIVYILAGGYFRLCTDYFIIYRQRAFCD